ATGTPPGARFRPDRRVPRRIVGENLFRRPRSSRRGRGSVTGPAALRWKEFRPRALLDPRPRLLPVDPRKDRVRRGGRRVGLGGADRWTVVETVPGGRGTLGVFPGRADLRVRPLRRHGRIPDALRPVLCRRRAVGRAPG